MDARLRWAGVHNKRMNTQNGIPVNGGPKL